MNDRLEELAEKDEDQYFYAEEYLVNQGEKFVSWIDLMGILDALENDQEAPAVWRAELISVISQYIDLDRVDLFTVGDGMIIITDDEDYLYEFLFALFNHYITFNINRRQGEWQDNIWLHRLIRAGIGHGPVYTINVEDYAEDFIPENPLSDDFANKPFGPGLIRALNAETGAPFSIHEVTQGGDIEPVKWWDEMDVSDDTRVDLMELLNEYFNWFDKRDEYRYSPYDSNHLIDSLRYFEIGSYSVTP